MLSLSASAVAIGAGHALWLIGTEGWPQASGVARTEDVIGALLAWLGAGLACWLALGAAGSALSALPGAAGEAGHRLAAGLTPALIRRLLSMALGASVGTLALPAAAVAGGNNQPGPATMSPSDSGRVQSGSGAAQRHGAVTAIGAAASPGNIATLPTTVKAPSPGFTPSGASSPGEPPDPGWTPSPPVPAMDPDRSLLLSPPPRTEAAVADTVTVRRGDSLWSLAARHLGYGASDAEIAREWPRWYAANRATIGDDPDRLLPGQQLVVPSTEEAIP